MEIFKLNTVLHPQSGNAFDSLAEAYLTSGNKELAKANYKKSVELNPKNTNAVEVLKTL
nr:tetratricopeptide repeat protein [Hymenobacter luteus]